MLCYPALARSTNWIVCENYTHDDHEAIRYCVGEWVQIASKKQNFEDESFR